MPTRKRSEIRGALFRAGNSANEIIGIEENAQKAVRSQRDRCRRQSRASGFPLGGDPRGRGPHSAAALTPHVPLPAGAFRRRFRGTSSTACSAVLRTRRATRRRRHLRVRLRRHATISISTSPRPSLEEAVHGDEAGPVASTGKELDVKIPAGVVAGQQIRLKGVGETAPGHAPGAISPDHGQHCAAVTYSRSRAATCASICYRSRCMKRRLVARSACLRG